MAKPASGTAINGSDAQGLATGLKAVWAFLEGSGTTSADSTGNGFTLTLDTGITWITDADGPLVQCAGTTHNIMNIATGFTTGNSWSVALGFSTTNGAGVNATVWSQTGGGAFGLVIPGTEMLVRGSGLDAAFTGATSFGTMANYLLTSDNTHTTLYTNGTQTQQLAIANGTQTFNALCQRPAGDYFNGEMKYLYVWDVCRNSTDASNLNTNPWEFFATATDPVELRAGMNAMMAFGVP